MLRGVFLLPSLFCEGGSLLKNDKITFYLGFSKNGCDDDLLLWINLLEKKGYKKTVYISKALFYDIHQIDIAIGNINIQESNISKYIPQICVTIKDPELVAYLTQKEKEGFKCQQVVKDAIRKSLTYSKDNSSVPSILELEYLQKKLLKDTTHNKKELFNLLNNLDKEELYALLSDMLQPNQNKQQENQINHLSSLLNSNQESLQEEKETPSSSIQEESSINDTQKNLIFTMEKESNELKENHIDLNKNIDLKEVVQTTPEPIEENTNEDKSEVEHHSKETIKNPFSKKTEEKDLENKSSLPKQAPQINPFVMAAID